MTLIATGTGSWADRRRPGRARGLISHECARSTFTAVVCTVIKGHGYSSTGTGVPGYHITMVPVYPVNHDHDSDIDRCDLGAPHAPQWAKNLGSAAREYSSTMVLLIPGYS